jgi:hypothetical protein
VPRLAAVAVLAASAMSPVKSYRDFFKRAAFRPDRPAVFLDASHRDVLDALRREADAQDVLVAHETDLLWLTPAHSGRLYCGHFFLTVDYEAKRAATDAFLSEPDAAFLTRAGIDLVFVSREDREQRAKPDRFATLSGLRVLFANDAGTLFRCDRTESTRDR